MNIYIVDNDGDTAEFLLLLLESNAPPGSNIETFRDGQTCLERINEIAPDVVVTDLQMPNMSGIILIQLIRAHPRTRLIPIIACSCAHNLRSEALFAGANVFFKKPFKNTKEVTSTVVDLVTRAQVSA